MMNVLICPAHNYVMPYGVMLQSLMEHTTENVVVYAIVDEDVTQVDKDALNGVLKTYGRQPISFYTFKTSIFAIFPGLQGSHLTRAAYFRLFASRILPNTIEKILYFDGDVIIRGNISNLYNYNICDYAIAGVMDHNQSLEQFNRLHYPQEKGYINSGVTLLNLTYWRNKNIESRFVDFINQYPERISRVADQDVINYVLQDEKMMLPLKFNVQNGFYFKPQYSKLDYWKYEPELLDAQRNPIVIHFSGPIKPWVEGCNHPMRQLFFDYQNRTQWAGTPIASLKRKTNILKNIRVLIRNFILRIPIYKQTDHKNRYIDDILC